MRELLEQTCHLDGFEANECFAEVVFSSVYAGSLNGMFTRRE